jgi:hypothetical protein
MRTRFAMPLACAVVAGCARGGGPALQASWVGKDTGQIAGTPGVRWCPVAGRLEITLVDKDRGLGLALYPEGSAPVAATYTGFDPSGPPGPRPGASAALRWFNERFVAGYQSDSGELVASGDSLRFSGRFSFAMRSVQDKESLRLSGRFHDLRAGACPADSAAAPPRTDSVSSGPPRK